MALAAADTASACHYLRNYAAFLANSHEYTKSNELLHRVKRLMPMTDNVIPFWVIFAENFSTFISWILPVTNGSRRGTMN